MPSPLFPKLPVAVQVAIGIPVFLLAGWWWYSYTGPYRWLAEWQIREFGTFYQTYTFLFVAVALVLLAALLVHLGCRLTGFDFDQQRTQESIETWKEWHEQRRGRLFCLFVGLVVVVISGQSYYVGKTAGVLTPMNVADLENGVKPASGWLVLKGALLREQAAYWTTNNNKSQRDVYVPFVSDDQNRSRSVSVIVYVNDRDGREEARLFLDGGESVDGLIDHHGLPGHVRTTLKDNGVTLVADPIVINYRSKPDMQLQLGTLGLILGTSLMSLGALVWLIKRDSLLPG